MQALATIHISVLSLFHPTELTVRPVEASAIVLQTAQSSETLEGAQTRSIKGPAQVFARDGGPAHFILSVPGRISREYFGKLEVKRSAGHLLAIMEMDLETAVASIVDGESPGSAPEARNAQAIAVRSYLLGMHGRHVGYDFCDTTHCQYLRGASHEGMAGQTAALNTRGLAISYQGKIVPALYSADCGGHTHTLREVGWRSDTDYPFFGVSCPVKSTQRGHGVGLCQRGAMELARQGKTFREILDYFFPGVAILALEAAD